MRKPASTRSNPRRGSTLDELLEGEGVRSENEVRAIEEVTTGSGNVFADLGYPNAHVHQAKAVLAAEIIKALDAAALTVRKAEARTGIAAADFSRIRNADLGRFTIDRLIRVLERLDTTVDVQVTVVRPPASAALAAVTPQRRTRSRKKGSGSRSAGGL